MMNTGMRMGSSGYPYCFSKVLGIQTGEDNASTLIFQFPLALTDGMWRLKADDQQIALFDFSLASLLDDNGNPANFVPLLRMNRDAQNANQVVSVDIEWQQYDSTSGNYVAVSDDEVTDKLVASSFINFIDYNTSTVGQDVSFIHYDEVGLISGNVPVDGDYQWFVNAQFSSDPANGIANASEISISYSLGGASYRFTWRALEN
jgi:hypothetical protein